MPSEILEKYIKDETGWLKNDPQVQDVIVEILERMQDNKIDLGSVFRKSYDRMYAESEIFEYGCLKNTEKSELGNIFQKEMLLQLKLEDRKKGRDTLIAGQEVDLKWTSSKECNVQIPFGWRIPPESHEGDILLLASSNDGLSVCHLGILRCSLKFLCKSQNRDGKKTLNALGRKSIFWIVKNKIMPTNKFLELDQKKKELFLEDLKKIKKLKETEIEERLDYYLRKST